MAPKKTDTPGPRFVGPGAFRVVPLAYPVEFEGKIYEAVTVKRCTVAQLQEFVEALKSDPDNAKLSCMVDCPIDLLDALFPDDYDDVDAVIRDFLPRRLRPTDETAMGDNVATEPTSSSGETIAASSPPNLDGATPSS